MCSVQIVNKQAAGKTNLTSISQHRDGRWLKVPSMLISRFILLFPTLISSYCLLCPFTHTVRCIMILTLGHKKDSSHWRESPVNNPHNHPKHKIYFSHSFNLCTRRATTASNSEGSPARLLYLKTGRTSKCYRSSDGSFEVIVSEYGLCAFLCGLRILMLSKLMSHLDLI